MHEGEAEEVEARPGLGAARVFVIGGEADTPDAIGGAGFDEHLVAGAEQEVTQSLVSFELGDAGAEHDGETLGFQRASSKPFTERPSALALPGSWLAMMRARVSSSAGLARTHLFGEKSRVRYASLYRLAPEASADALEEELKAALAGSPYVRTRTHTNAQPNIQRSLKRVEDYLGLVALLSLLLGGIGVSQIVRAWLAGRAQSVAVLRCLGYRAREIAASYLGHVLVLALAGSLLGAALGAMLPALVRSYAPELFEGAEVSLLQPAAVVRGVVLGLLVAALFSLPSLTAIWRVPPAAVLRAEAVPLDAPRVVRFGGPVALFVGVLLAARWQGGAWLPALVFSGGLLVLTALLYGGARLASRLSARVPRGRFGPYVEHGLAAFSRPAPARRAPSSRWGSA